MALNTQLADATVNAQALAFAVLCNSGFMKFYDGAQPSTADTALGSQTLGVTLGFASTAFGAAVSGLLTANSITSGIAVGTITPTWCRLLKSDGVTVVCDVSAGVSGANATIGAFTSGTTVNCTSFTHDVLNASAGL